MDSSLKLDGWALVLGASSGFGAATARSLARAGMNIAGVHLDRRAAMPQIDALVAELKGLGREVAFFNVNAADEVKRKEVLDELATKLGGGPTPSRIRVLLHSLAFGTLKPAWEPTGDVLTKANVDMTLDVMANSLLYWTQDVLRRELFARDSRIFAMTSAGSFTVWKSYGAVSAAKAALEALVRQLAVELAPTGITANAICAGVTDTAALRKIPGSTEMIEAALRRNPHKRLTTVEDVANVIAVLARPETSWMTGNVINVDGGEDIAG